MKRILLPHFFFLLISAFLPVFVRAQQAPVVAWDKTFGANNNDDFSCMIRTPDGGYILGGNSISGANGDKTQASKGSDDYWIIKLDANFNKLWDKTYGGSSLDNLISLLPTADGGYLLAGQSNSQRGGDKSQPAIGDYDFWIVKIDANGNKLWDKTFGGYFSEGISDIISTSDGGFLIGGSSNSPISSHKSEDNFGPSNTADIWILKLNASGNIIWDRTIGGTGSERLAEIHQTVDGGYILAGSSDSDTSGYKSQLSKGLSDYWIVKLDASGIKLWDKTYGGNREDNLTSFKPTSDGGYIAAGFSNSHFGGDKSQPSRGFLDFWIIKLDAAGNLVWEKTIGGDKNDYCWAVNETPDGGFVLAGRSESDRSAEKSEPPKGNGDGWVVKLDKNGTKIWDKTIGGFSSDDIRRIIVLPGNELLLGAASSSGISGDKTTLSKGSTDYWLVKLNAPCSNLSAKLIPECLVGGTKLNLEVGAIQNTRGKRSWTLNYTENGIPKILIDSASNLPFAFNPKPGTVFKLVSITSGTCTTTLNQTFTASPFPALPVAENVSRCGPGKVTLTATGAPAGSKYAWYNVPTTGTPLQTDSIGKFTTPELKEPTLYYVSVINELGCEGARTQVLASLDYCPPVFIPNIITQNHDGKNDTFQPQNLRNGNWSLQIFNRWGKQVFETDNYQQNWPEEKISVGTYYYLLQNQTTDEKYKGWVEITE